MIKYNKLLITLTGHTCSGKNYFLEKVIADFGFNRIVSCTSRPMREGEVEGYDYYFCNQNEMFHNSFYNMKYIENILIGKYNYAVTLEEFEKKVTEETPGIIIVTPEGVKQYKKICDDYKIKIVSFFIDTPQEIRKERFIKRALTELQNKDANDVITSMLDRYEQMIINERQWNAADLGDAIVLDGSDLDWALETFAHHIKRAKRELTK